MSPLRIALFSSDFPPAGWGGTGQWSFGLVRALAALGHRPTVFTQASSVRRTRMHDGAPYGVVAMGDREWKRLRSTYAAWHGARAVFSRRFDVVLAAHWAYAPMPVFLSRWWPVRTVVVTLGSEVLRRMNPPEFRRFRSAITRSTLAVSISRCTRARVTERLGIPEHRVAVVPCGVDAERFDGKADVADLRARFGLGTGPVVLTVARLAPKKGHDVLIRAMPEILRRHPGATYVAAGGGAAADVERLRAVARAAGVEKRVVFTGYVPAADVPRWYALADVFAMLSREEGRSFEGFGLSYLEANACGKPVVAGRSGGVLDAVDEGRTGFLVDPLDERAAAEKLCLLLGDPALARTMGEAGRRRVLEGFTWDHVARRLLAELDQRTR